NENENSGLILIWAIGIYPVGHKDCEVEMTLFVAIDFTKRDSDTQAVFEKNEFYSVRSKIVPGKYNNSMRLKMTVSSSTLLKILDKVPKSNKCPLKISLVGITQKVPKEVSDDDNAVFDVLVTDYADINNIDITKVKASDCSSSQVLETVNKPQSSSDELRSSKHLKTDYNDGYRDSSYIEEEDFIEVEQVDYETQLEANNVVRKFNRKERIKELLNDVGKSQKEFKSSYEKSKVHITRSVAHKSDKLNDFYANISDDEKE
ncbi:923_t:CDS:2, partial [Cetraspora pellucida]